METFYITCAIDYPNSPPHLGTAYEKIAADAIARFQRLAGREVRFLLGLDEHSQNVEQKARGLEIEPQVYCDRMAEVFRQTWRQLEISNDRFIRTTEARHGAAVREMLRRSEANGDVYTDLYEGWYCVGCEGFYTERELVDGKCPLHQKKPDWRQEENAFFRLSRYTQPLLQRLEKHPEMVLPEIRRNEVLSLLHQGLADISISRRGAEWGIPMPGHEGQAVYVWFDALTNYLTDVGFPDDADTLAHFWPANLHLVGKDITRFHCLIWPAMLMSAGLELPRTVFGHGFVQRGGGRMSKTIGNVIDPIAAAETVGIDGLRYFLLREVRFGRDLDFDLDKLQERYNADLANDLGNLAQRTLAMARKYRECSLQMPSTPRVVTVLPEVGRQALQEYRRAFEDYDLQEAIAAAWSLVAAANLAIDTHKPWELAKQPGSSDELDAVLLELIGALRDIARMLYPIMPQRAAEMGRQLGIEQQPRHWRLTANEEEVTPTVLYPGAALFPRLEI